MNPFRKKFPRNEAPEPPGRDADEFSVDDDPLSRTSKVRGGIEVMHIQTDDTFNPYQRHPEDRKADGGTRRDLRKLSEHIKLMRELEERKKRDD